MSSAQKATQEVMRFTALSRNVLTADEAELYELSQLAGIVIDPNIFKIIVDLLRMNVAPAAIDRMLKSMTSQQRRRPTTEGSENMPPPSSSGSSSRGRIQSRGRTEKTK